MLKRVILIVLPIFTLHFVTGATVSAVADIASKHFIGRRQGDVRGQTVRVQIDGKSIDLYDESHALLIGVSDYTNGWSNLRGVKTDVQQVRAVLEKQGFKVEVMVNPTHDALDQGLKRFISAHGLKTKNRVLIYFAGHGFTEELLDGRDMGYIVPADAPLPDRDPQLFNQRAISMDFVEAYALQIKSNHALFIFDSCFSGTIFETRGKDTVPPEIESKVAEPVRQFISSGTRNQKVPDDSVFRHYFVRAFELGEGDLNGDWFITGEELGVYLKGRVSSDTKGAQTPRHGKIKNARLNVGDFVFRLPKNETKPTQTATVLTTPAVELGEQAFWEEIKNSNDPADFEDYINKYKETGIYYNAAQARLRRLKTKDAAQAAQSEQPSSSGTAIAPGNTKVPGTPVKKTATPNAAGGSTGDTGMSTDTLYLKSGGMVKGEFLGFENGKFAMRKSKTALPVQTKLSELDRIVIASGLSGSILYLRSGHLLRGSFFGYENGRFSFETGGQRLEFRSDQVSRLVTLRNDVVDKVTGRDVSDPPSSMDNKLSSPNGRWESGPFDVKLEEQWLHSQIWVARGQRVRVEASGVIYLEGRTAAGPEGLQGRRDPDSPMPQQNDGALIVAIGRDVNLPSIFIGNSREFTADRDGALYFTVNHWETRDARGAFRVNVTVDLSGGGGAPNRNDAGTNKTPSSPSGRWESASPFDVKLEAQWIRSQIRVARGDRVRVDASGTIYLEGRTAAGPEGLQGQRDKDSPMPQQNDGGLIAAIGQDQSIPSIFIGRAREFTAEQDGVLYFTVNHWETRDARGAFRVNVTVDRGSGSATPAGVTGGSGPGQKREKTITVYANQPWTDTGIIVEPNMTFEVTAEGTIEIGPGSYSNPDGNRSAIVNTASYPIRDVGVGALIGKIRYADGRDSNFVFIGSRGMPGSEPNENGRLFLGINDDYFRDNNGSYSVTIRW